MKHTLKLLTLAAILTAVFGLTGCPGPVNTETPCTHENKKTVIETAATCTETGLEKIICADCGELIEEKTIEALGHDWEEIITDKTKAATCTEDGIAVYKCKTCGAIEERTTNKLGHDLGEWTNWTITNPATVDHEGTETRTRTCKRTGCNHSETETRATTHNYEGGGCDIEGCEQRYEFDDYQITVYIYKNVSNDELKQLEQLEQIDTLYFSFDGNNLTSPVEMRLSFGVPTPTITISDLVHLKTKYKNARVTHCRGRDISTLNLNDDWSDDYNSLAGLAEVPFHVVIE